MKSRKPATGSTARSAKGGRASKRGRPSKPLSQAKLAKAPFYSKAEQALIATFLGVAKEAASEGRKQALDIARGTPRPSPFWDQFDYWNNVCSACDWLLWRSTTRQRHLLIAQVHAQAEGKPA